MNGRRVERRAADIGFDYATSDDDVGLKNVTGRDASLGQPGRCDRSPPGPTSAEPRIIVVPKSTARSLSPAPFAAGLAWNVALPGFPDRLENAGDRIVDAGRRQSRVSTSALVRVNGAFIRMGRCSAQPAEVQSPFGERSLIEGKRQRRRTFVAGIARSTSTPGRSRRKADPGRTFSARCDPPRSSTFACSSFSSAMNLSSVRLDSVPLALKLLSSGFAVLPSFSPRVISPSAWPCTVAGSSTRPGLLAKRLARPSSSASESAVPLRCA